MQLGRVTGSEEPRGSVSEGVAGAPSPGRATAPGRNASDPSADSLQAFSPGEAVRAGSTLGASSAYGSPGLEALLDRETGSKARPGNQVRLLIDGVGSFAERNRLIDEASSSIHLQTFIFTDDATGWDLARRLGAKADEGVKVRVIVDALGSQRSSPKLFDYMRAHGVEVRAYGDPVAQFWDLNDRWHEKHLIVDGRVSIEGGMNIGDEYALGGTGRAFARDGKLHEAWRDVDVRLEGPSVADAQRAFLKNWTCLGAAVPENELPALLAAQVPGAGGAKVRVVQHRPDQERDQNVNALYLRAIETARAKVVIENAYFVPPPELRRALVDAARRGVDVQVLTNSRASSDQTFVCDAARYFYDELIAAGVKIWEKQGGTLHAKTATFDGAYSIVGSANLNGRSKGRDSEVVAAIEDTGTARALEQRFLEGTAAAKQVTAAELHDESFFKNLNQWSLSLLSWTF